MKTTLAILAVTLMKTGVCIAGVRADAPQRWVRPVREFGRVLLGDITYPTASAGPRGSRASCGPSISSSLRSNAHARTASRRGLDLRLLRATDRVWSAPCPRIAAALLEAAACEPAALWDAATRSLGALAVDDLTATFQRDTYTGKYEARLGFAGLPADAATAACTDLKWRALGRRLLADAPRTLRCRRSRSAAATSRLAQHPSRSGWRSGRHAPTTDVAWPLVVGVHTLPDYEADIDYARSDAVARSWAHIPAGHTRTG